MSGSSTRRTVLTDPTLVEILASPCDSNSTARPHSRSNRSLWSARAVLMASWNSFLSSLRVHWLVRPLPFRLPFSVSQPDHVVSRRRHGDHLTRFEVQLIFRSVGLQLDARYVHVPLVEPQDTRGELFGKVAETRMIRGLAVLMRVPASSGPKPESTEGHRWTA